MSQPKPGAWLYESDRPTKGTFATRKEELAVVRAAVTYVKRVDENTNDDAQFEALVVAVQKLLAKRKKAKR